MWNDNMFFLFFFTEGTCLLNTNSLNVLFRRVRKGSLGTLQILEGFNLVVNCPRLVLEDYTCNNFVT